MMASKRSGFIGERGSRCAHSQKSYAFQKAHMTCVRTALASLFPARSRCTMIWSTSKFASPRRGADSGILIRTCEGRRDYEGGRNHLAPLSLLDHPAELAEYVRAVMSGDLSLISRMFGPLAHKRLARG